MKKTTVLNTFAFALIPSLTHAAPQQDHATTTYIMTNPVPSTLMFQGVSPTVTAPTDSEGGVMVPSSLMFATVTATQPSASTTTTSVLSIAAVLSGTSTVASLPDTPSVTSLIMASDSPTSAIGGSVSPMPASTTKAAGNAAAAGGAKSILGVRPLLVAAGFGTIGLAYTVL